MVEMQAAKEKYQKKEKNPHELLLPWAEKHLSEVIKACSKSQVAKSKISKMDSEDKEFYTEAFETHTRVLRGYQKMKRARKNLREYIESEEFVEVVDWDGDEDSVEYRKAMDTLILMKSEVVGSMYSIDEVLIRERL